ncbi:hypothetical protein QAD02_006439 [Eretmocerus hayati]|uniref:Uncharacterized protein n=1 Tax=Eretmocerus hayati TaxID=131215 RepID=A0ACC2N184_9HYME|nr:hypothetical protein QAD02_006439 [Eretmocerus hayati]
MSDAERADQAEARLAELTGELETMRREMDALRNGNAQRNNINNANNGAINANNVPAQQPIVPQDPIGHVNAYAPKIAPFMAKDPVLWYIRAESSLRTARITSDATKLDYLVQQLSEAALVAVRDILMLNPQPADAYQQVKDRLISTFGTSDEQTLRQLLRGEVNLDGKPSFILNQLRNKNQANFPDDVLRSIFLDTLPENHRYILAVTNATDLDGLAAAADKLAEIPSLKSQVYNVNSSSFSNSSASNVQSCAAVSSSKDFDDAFKKMNDKINALSSKIDRLFSQNRERSQQRAGNSQASNEQQPRDPQKICKFHKKYNEGARYCKPWCFSYPDFVKAQAKKESSKND